jgi:hypothetical protein
VSESEIEAVTGRLDDIMGRLRANVAALQAILTDLPEVQDDQPAATA